MQAQAVADSEAAAGAILEIDLAALQANYRTLAELSAPAECAAVVKANAYGTGLEQAVDALAAAGCRTFFVALLGEAERLRARNEDAQVYVLNGLFPGTAEAFAQIGARPVLNSLAEIEEWAAFCRRRGGALPAGLHVDTGINRLGLNAAEMAELADSRARLEAFAVSLVMSHLACADEPDNAMNAKQLARFAQARAALPEAPASLANSGGILLGPAYRLDMVRAGVALYGGNPVPAGPAPTAPVVHLRGRVAQLREVAEGETIGYGATFRCTRPSRIALVAAGYGDGYFRRLGRTSDGPGADVAIDGVRAPVVGRVSMDSLAVDVTDLAPGRVRRGDLVELIGEHIGVDEIAAKAGTIGYEVLTSLGARYARRYAGP